MDTRMSLNERNFETISSLLKMTMEQTERHRILIDSLQNETHRLAQTKVELSLYDSD